MNITYDGFYREYIKLNCRINIAFSEWELKLMREHYASFNCRRNGQVRIIDYFLNSDLAFSKEDEQRMFQLFSRLDRLFENIIDDKRDKTLEAANDSGQEIDKSLAIGLITEKKQFQGQHDVTVPCYYDWSISIDPEQTSINNIPVFNINVERQFFVDIMVDKIRNLNQNEIRIIPNDPGVTFMTTEGFQQRDISPESLPSGEPLPVRVVINGFSFPGETGLRILKLRNETCPFPKWQKAWEVLESLTFREITERIKDIERRRLAISFLGMERIMAQIESKKISEETIEKLTTWVDTHGQLKEHRYSDTYSLHRVSWKTLYGDLSAETLRRLNQNQLQTMNQHFVKCNCTSTGNDYLIWVDLRQVYQTNHPEEDHKKLQRISLRRIEKMVDPIEAIAWTFETQLAKGSIEAIIRQGDCILMRPSIDPILKQKRHLTGEEYRTLLRSES
jgi:hypothetical protein